MASRLGHASERVFRARLYFVIVPALVISMLSSISGLKAGATSVSSSSFCAKLLAAQLEGLIMSKQLRVVMADEAAAEAIFPGADILIDYSPGKCRTPEHIVVRWLDTNRPLHLFKPTSDISEASLVTTRRGMVLTAVDRQGKTTSLRLITRPGGFSLYRFGGVKMHLSMGENFHDLQSSEIGVAADRAGPFFFQVVWPEAGIHSGAPHWPLTRSDRTVRIIH